MVRDHLIAKFFDAWVHALLCRQFAQGNFSRATRGSGGRKFVIAGRELATVWFMFSARAGLKSRAGEPEQSNGAHARDESFGV